jgi:hypothetical protein
MSQMLGRLIGSQGRFIEQMFAGLEQATGQHGYDADVVGRILTANNYKLHQLGFVSGTVTATELRPVVEQRFAELEKQFEQRFLTDQALAQAMTEALQSVEVLELSPVMRNRLDLHQADLVDQIAQTQRGYWQFQPLKVTLDAVQFDKRLIPAVRLQLASTKLRQCSLTALAVVEQVRQSNQLVLILASVNYSVRLRNWLEQGNDQSWTLAGFPVANEAIERIMADRESELYRQLQSIQPDIAQRLTDFRLEDFVNRLIGDMWFADSYGLGVVGDELVSLNIFDQMTNDNQQLYTTVYRQLIAKYLQNPNLCKQILQQLERYLRMV